MSAAMDTNIDTIYVRLLDEGTDVMRPVPARRLSTGDYEVLKTDDYNPDHEIWEFTPGSVVRCEWLLCENERIRLAVTKIN